MFVDDNSEKALIRELKEGSYRAFNSIYELYSRRLFAYCLSFSKSREIAEEIVQDVFVRLWTCRENIRQDETLCSLLFVMSRNKLINSYKARIKSPVFEDYIYCNTISCEDKGFRKMEFDEFENYLKRKIEELPTTQRRIIEMSRIRQMNNKEIAKELGLSEQTVKNQMSLGLKTLRKELGRHSYLLLLLLLVN